MTNELVPLIENLLFVHNTLAIPGLGTFQSNPVNSRTDAASGVVTPPSRTLNFNENLQTDDGILSEEVAKALGIPTQDATNRINAFVKEIHELLERREIVTLEGVGRLYKNYVQKIQFLPDAKNYNTDSYGLPDLQYSPIARSKESVEQTIRQTREQEPVQSRNKSAKKQTAEAGTQPKSAPAAPPATEDPFYEPQKRTDYFPLIGLGVIIALVVAAYFMLKPGKDTTAENGQQENSETLVNTAPGEEGDNTAGNDTETAGLDGSNSSIPDKPADTDEFEDVPLEPVFEDESGTSKESIVVIGLFGDKNNVERLKKLLTDNGFDIYEAPKGKATQVGAKFNYSNPDDFQQQLTKLKNLTGVPDLWVKKK